MPGFSIRNPYFIVVICLTLLVIGVTSIARMPVDLFPPINLPEVVVATFYSGMPPEDVETDITDPLERFFTLAAGVDHFESRSLLGVSIIKVYFQPGTSPDADVTALSNLALADLKRLPPGTLPPVVLKFDASSLPVALVTVKGEGLNETQLHDYAQFQIRNQITVVPGSSIPGVFGGIYRQVMVYVDPYKLSSRQLSLMDVVGAVNQSNLILPAGDVKMGPYDYFVYSNSLVNNMDELGKVPLKVNGHSWVTVNDVGKAEDAHGIQTNIVRIDGQKSAYIPIMKQGGDTNTIAVVDGVRQLIKHLYDIPKQMVTSVVFDQSVYVKEAIATVLHEGFLGLILTSIMILVFLGSFRATSAVLLSIPLSALAAFVILALMGGTINTMILGGMALAFSRVIDNSVISLENIYRHLEMGAAPMVAAEVGGAEVNLAVLAATLVDVVDFFPVVFLYGVAKFLFSALALAFCLSLLASYVVAMTVIPLFCSRFLKAVHPAAHGNAEYEVEPTTSASLSWMDKLNARFNRMFNKLLDFYEKWVRRAVMRPGLTVLALAGVFVLSLAIYPLTGLAFFPKTDAGQFTINLKVPTGTRIEVTDQYVAKVEDLIRGTMEGKDLRRIVSNIGVVPDFSALYTTNAGPYTATVQVQLNESHRLSSFEYMDRVQKKMASQFPDIRTFFSSGSMVDAILNTGMPAPIDVQVSSSDLAQINGIAQDLAARIREIHGVGQVYVPQDINYPALRLDVDRVHAGELGLSQKDVVDNVITALNSNYMIAPNYWVDRKSGNDYYLTVQYFEKGPGAIHNLTDLGTDSFARSGLSPKRELRPVRRAFARKCSARVELFGGGKADHRAEQCRHRQAGADSYRGRPLPDPESHRCLCDALGRGSGTGNERDSQTHLQDRSSRQRARESARHGRRHGSVVQELCVRIPDLVSLAVPDFDCSIQIVHRSVSDYAGDSHGIRRCADHSAAHRQHVECDVADGRADAGRHRGFEQHSDRRFCAQPGKPGLVADGRGHHRMPGTPSTYPDDVIGHDHRNDPHGAEDGHGCRTVCSDGAGDHRRTDFVGRADHFYRARCISAGLREA